jgi:hypothetical protein
MLQKCVCDARFLQEEKKGEKKREKRSLEGRRKKEKRKKEEKKTQAWQTSPRPGCPFRLSLPVRRRA